MRSDPEASPSLREFIQGRFRTLEADLAMTLRRNTNFDAVASLFLRWMNTGTIVRVFGAGRALLAGALSANRLAHGGARVFIQNDMAPMPPSSQGGGLIAVSASGETESVLRVLRTVHEKRLELTTVGIARADAEEFRNLCTHFLGIHHRSATSNSHVALADSGEYVIYQLLDALVVAAGNLGGFDEARWRLGHEDLGPTGPYTSRPPKSAH